MGVFICGLVLSTSSLCTEIYDIRIGADGSQLATRKLIRKGMCNHYLILQSM